MYYKNKNNFVKLTIRIDEEELNKFKELCSISKLSANNQINILIREYIHNKKYLLEENYSIPELDKLWGNSAKK
jgi:hypothetical protein